MMVDHLLFPGVTGEGASHGRLALQFRLVCRRFGFRYFFFGVNGCHNSILLPSGS
jgi:hypothetical protein